MREYIFLFFLFIASPIYPQLLPDIQNEKRIKQRWALITDSIYVCIINGKYIPTDFGNFVKNDTLRNLSGQILRTSEASNGFLNGNLIYYSKSGNIWIKARLKDGEYCDTTYTYVENGRLKKKTIHVDNENRIELDYYETGQVRKVTEVHKTVDYSDTTGGKYPIQNSEIYGEHYFDEYGNDISDKIKKSKKLSLSYNNCSMTFCVDCGETKARPNYNLDIFFNEKINFDLLKYSKLEGIVFFQLLVDTIGNPCLKSISNISDKDSEDIIKSFNFDKIVSEMPLWVGAVQQGVKWNSSVLLQVDFVKKKKVRVEFAKIY